MFKKLTTEGELEQVLNLSSYAFNIPISDSIRTNLTTTFPFTTNWGVMAGNQLTSQIIAIPLHVSLFDQSVKMAGIANVATYPEYRGQGGIQQLFKAIFAELREDGTVLSYLAPFSQPFYRKYGYEVVFSRVTSTVHRRDMDQLPVEKAGRMERIDCSQPQWHSVIKKLYSESLAKDTGSLLREDWWWERIFQMAEKVQYALCFNDSEEPVGYLAYEMLPGEFKIHEACYTSPFAVRKMAAYVATHTGTFETFNFSHPSSRQVKLLFPEAQGITQTTHEGMMVKIVSFEKFIQQYSFKRQAAQSFTLAVTDTFTPWNHGTWQLEIVDGKATIHLLDEQLIEADFSGTIQSWTQVFLGHSPLATQCFLETIQTKQPNKMAELSALLPESHLGLHDYF